MSSNFDNIEEQQERALKRQQQRFDQMVQRGRGRGRAFIKPNPEEMKAQGYLKGFLKPQVSKKELDEKIGASTPARKRYVIQQRAKSARALWNLAHDDEADPKARQYAQKQIEEHGLDSWLELYDLSESLQDLNDITEKYSHKEISDKEFQRRLDELDGDDLHPTTAKALKKYRTLVPLQQKFEQEKKKTGAEYKTMRVYDPGQEHIKKSKDKTYTDFRVSSGEVRDTSGKLIMRPTESNDMRAPGLAAKIINEFMLDNSEDPQKVQKKGKTYIPVMLKGASQTTKDMYDGAFEIMQDLPNGKQLSKSYGVKTPDMNMGM